MEGVAELVRQGRDIVEAILEVHLQVGVHTVGRSGEGAARLVVGWVHVHPTVGRVEGNGRLLRAGSWLVSDSVHLHSNGRDTTAHLEIGFRFPTHVDLVTNAEGGAMMQAIREAAADALGRPVEVVPVLWEELAQAKRQAAPAPASSGGHLLEEALEQGATRAEG